MSNRRVKDLIAKLQTMDPEAVVIVYCRATEDACYWSGAVIPSVGGDTNSDERSYVNGDWPDYRDDRVAGAPVVIIE